MQKAPLAVQHEARVACAANHLAPNPLRAYGVEWMIADALEGFVELANPQRKLPDVREYFIMSL